MPNRIAKDTPLSEVTLRKYEKPVDISERDLVRKLCLSLGLLQPGDSRDVIVFFPFLLKWIVMYVGQWTFVFLMKHQFSFYLLLAT